MPPLTAETYINQFAELFWPLVQQEQERQAVLEGAFYSENWVLGEIVLGGKPRPFAKQCLVTLHRLRPGDGRLLAVLLDNLWYDVGEAGQEKITALRDHLPHFCAHVAAHTAPPAATESTAKISQQIEPGRGSININVAGNLTMRDVTNAPHAPHPASTPADTILSPAVYLSYSDSDPASRQLAEQAAHFLQAHGHPCRQPYIPDYIGSDAWLDEMRRAHNAAYTAVILVTSYNSHELEIDHLLLCNKQQQGKQVILWQPDTAVALPDYLAQLSLPRVTTLDDLLPHLPATRGVATRGVASAETPPFWGTGTSRRAREKAYLDDLLARELRHVSRYTPLSGQSLIRPTPTGRLAFDPIVARPEFAHSPWRQAQREAEPSEVRRFEDPVPELQAIRQAVVLGEPGAGKTTTLYKLASDLAYRLAEDPRAPIPLLIPLGLWTDATQPLPSFLAAQLGALGADLPALLDEGRAALLLDGLNEIPANQHAAKYAEVKAFIAAEREKNSDLLAIVTCREQDYPSNRHLAIDRVEVAPLDPVRVHSFVCRYVGDEAGERLFWQLAGEAAQRKYAEFMAEVGQKLDAPWETFWLATVLPDGVQWGFDLDGYENHSWEQWLDQRRQPQSLLRLAFNPYLLTMLVDVWCAAEGQLPANRGQLFAGFVDILLRREDARLPAEEKLIGTATGSALLHALSELAYAMQSATDDVDQRQARTAVPLAEAVRYFTDRQRYLAASANLITLRGAELRFTHQLLQEYFAARALQRQLFPAGDSTASPALAPTIIWSPDKWWEPTNWEETVILLAGLYSDDCTPVVRWLAEAQPELASRCIVESGADVSEATLRWLRQKWVPRLTDEQNEPEPRSRAGVGRALGRLTLPDGEPLDNRLGTGLHADGLPDIVWGGVVPAGSYNIGEDAQSDNQKRTWRIAEPYQLAKYPITYVQFQAFVEAADFHDVRWWRDMPEHDGRRPTKEIAEQAFPYATHPREMVSWYQAVAFCRWLSQKLGYEVRLPHEYEWEVAARYGHDKVYPWGSDEIDARLTNYDGNIGQPTAVGLYPAGRQPQLDLYDLSGNVWEWCQNQYDDVTQVGAAGARRVVRGGSCYYDPDLARVPYRHNLHPYARYSDLGMRVVRRPPSHL